MQERVIKEESEELKRYFFILVENWILFISIFLIVCLFVFLITEFTKPTYQSTSLILIEAPDKGLSFLPIKDFNTRQTFINNHIEMIQSRTLFERVDNVIQKYPFFDSLYVSKFKEKNKRISYLKKNLMVLPLKDTDILKIIYNDRTPSDAFYITNVIVQQYYEINLELTRSELSEVRKFLEDQLVMIENNLKKTEEDLRNYKETNYIIKLSEETSKLVEMISSFEGQQKQLNVEREMLLAKLNYIKEDLNQSYRIIADGIIDESNPFLIRSFQELDSLQSSYAFFLSMGYDTMHPKMREIHARVEKLKNNIISKGKDFLNEKNPVAVDPVLRSKNLIDELLAVQMEIKIKESMIRASSNVINVLEQKMKKIPYHELMLARLERNKKVSEELYLMLKSKYEESKVAEAGKLGSVKIIDKPVLNPVSVSPKKNRNYFFGFFLALLTAMGTVFIKEYVDDTVKDIDEIERDFKINIIGNIPLIKIKNGKQLSSEKGKLLTDLPENSSIIESYKILRTNILYLYDENQPKVIVVSSATKGEGKSTTASNLCLVLSQLDKKVLLVDGDMRRPVLDKIFKIDFNKGFVHLLKGEANIDEVLYPTGIKNLWLLPYGEKTSHSTELLEGKLTQKIFTQLREKFDFIVVDTSPILSIADPTIISRLADGLLWIIHFKKAKKRELHYTKKLLKNMNINIMGIVFNNINTESFYGKYYYYHYYYHYQTKEGEK